MTARDRTDTRDKAGAGAPGLLIIAHGERGGAGEDRLAHHLAEAARATGRFATVAAGFIRSEPPLERAAQQIAETAYTIYPLFMSDGYYVKRAIPERLGIENGHDNAGRAVTFARPLGLDAALPGLVADMAAAAAAKAGHDPEDTHLLIVAHGSSKSGESADAARAVAARVAGLAPFAAVDTCFLEEEPYLDAALAGVPGPAVLLGLFAGEGMHAAEDLPLALEKSGRTDVALAPSLGEDPRLVPRIIAILTGDQPG